MTGKRLEDICFQPGDTLGFTAWTPAGVAITFGTWGLPLWSISHVGGIVQVRDELLISEATRTCPYPCHIQNERVQGLQVQELERRIRTYPGLVWHYPLTSPLSREGERRLTLCLLANLGKDYDELGAFRVRQACFGWLLKYVWPENLRTLYCSEWWAAALRRASRFQTRSASRWNPKRLCRALVKRGVCAKPVCIKTR